MLDLEALAFVLLGPRWLVLDSVPTLRVLVAHMRPVSALC